MLGVDGAIDHAEGAKYWELRTDLLTRETSKVIQPILKNRAAIHLYGLQGTEESYNESSKFDWQPEKSQQRLQSC